MALESLERTFIARLADRVPPARELIEEIYDRILQYEDVSGRAVGKEERLVCLSWAIDTYRERQALNELLAQLAHQRAARAAQTSAPASGRQGNDPFKARYHAAHTSSRASPGAFLLVVEPSKRARFKPRDHRES